MAQSALDLIMDEFNQILLYGVALPAGIAAILVLRSPGRIAAALALPMVAYILIRFGWTGEAWQYTMFAPLSGLAVGLMLAFSPRTVGVRAVLAVVLGALVTLSVWPIVKNDEWLIRLIPGAAAMLLFALLDPMAGPKGQVSLALGLAICAGAAAVAFKGIRFGLPMGALAVALVILAAAMWRRRELTLAGGPLAVVAATFGAYPLVAWLYAGGMDGDAAPTSYAILTAAPLLLWAGMPGREGEGPARKADAARIAVAVLACGAAVAFAFLAPEPVEDETSGMSDAEKAMHDAMMEMYQGGDGE